MGKWKKLTAFAPALAAVIVAACAGISLNGYTAPVYAVEQPEALVTPEPEQDTDAAEKKDDTKKKDDTQKTTDTEAELVAAVGSGSFELADGTYEGSGTGFGGTMKVCVVVSGGKIASIDIVENSDTPSYLSSASSLISTIISTQSTNVDTVSGATYSSRGIIEAVRSALSQAAVNGSSSTNGGIQSNTNNGNNSQNNNQNNNNSSASKGSFPYQDGIYYGTAAGFQGDIKVAVALQDQTIKAVLILGNEDDETFFNRAKVVADRIVDGQKTDVDLVSGATYSSRGIQNAVKQALENAKKATNGETVPDNGTSSGGTTTIPEGKFPYEEGIYYGTGEGYLGDITTAVVIQDETIKAILVTESEDDEAFLKRAKQTAKDVVKNQTLKVDTVSGATYSSRGILAAIEEALKEAERVTEEKKNPTPTPTVTPYNY